MLVVGRVGGLIRKKKSLNLPKKNTRLNPLIVSLQPYPKLNSLVETLKKPKGIVAIDDQVVEQPATKPQV